MTPYTKIAKELDWEHLEIWGARRAGKNSISKLFDIALRDRAQLIALREAVGKEGEKIVPILDWVISEWPETGVGWVGCYHCHARFVGSKNPKYVTHEADCMVRTAYNIRDHLKGLL